MVDNETCVAFEFCVVEAGEVVEIGCVVDAAEVEALGSVELVVVLDVEEIGVVIVVGLIDDVVIVVDFAGNVEIAEFGLLEDADEPVDVFEVLEGEGWEETVVMRLGSTMLLHRSP